MREIREEHADDWADSHVPITLGDWEDSQGRIDPTPGGPHHDPVSSPIHYTKGGIDCLDYILSKNMNHLEGCIVKYITRYKYKGGLQDLEKARQYLDRLIVEYRREEGIR